MNTSTLKTSRTYNNDPWAILIALACLIIVATGVAIVVIIILWDRYRKNRMMFDRNMLPGFSYEMPTTSAMVSFNENPEIIQNDMRQPKEYEIQSLDMYVPSDEREEYIGGMHPPGMAPNNNGMRPINHVREMQLNPNFYQNTLNRNLNPNAINNNIRPQPIRLPINQYGPR